MRSTDPFPTVQGSRGCGPTVSIRFSRVEFRALLLVCLDEQDEVGRRKAKPGTVGRRLLMESPRFQAALKRAEKGLTEVG